MSYVIIKLSMTELGNDDTGEKYEIWWNEELVKAKKLHLFVWFEAYLQDMNILFICFIE